MQSELSLLEKINKFVDYLRGEEIPDGCLIESPKLSQEQAENIVYMMQMFLEVIPDSYDVCANCGCVYDSYEQGNYHYCEECDNKYCEEYYKADCDDKAALNCKSFCCDECELEFLWKRREAAMKAKEIQEIKIRYCLKNKHTDQLHFKWYHISEIKKGLDKLFDLENYDIIARDLFTGKQIKNKDAYVCDIIKSKIGVVGIVYNPDLMRFEASTIYGRMALHTYLEDNPDSEIIGNKHQSQELLEA